MLTTPSIKFIENCTIAPLTKLVPASISEGGQFDGGIYHSNGDICVDALQIKGSYKNIPKDFNQLEIESNSDLNNCLFGGMMQNEHFGHFLIESLSRLWATNYLNSKIDTVVFYPRIPIKGIPKFANETFNLLGLQDKKIKLITAAKKIESLAIPNQVVDGKSGVVYGHPVIRELFLPLRKISTLTHKKVYVSRAGLKEVDGGILHEKIIEENLSNEGYTIVHPEKITLKDQLSIYNNADALIFADGSALHLYAMVARSDQKVFVIWRKKVNGIFNWQIQTFGGPKILGDPCIKKCSQHKAAQRNKWLVEKP